MNGASWGRSQHGRHPAALDPAYARVDERSVADFLHFAREYATLLKFHERGGAGEHDWRGLFDADISFLLAEICLFDPRKAEFQTNALSRRIQWKPDGTLEAVKEAYQGLRRIGQWHACARRTEAASGDALALRLASTIEKVIGDGSQPGQLRACLLSVRGNRAWHAMWERLADADAGSGQAGERWDRAAPWTTEPATPAGAATPAQEPAELPMILNHLVTNQSTLRSFAHAELARSLDSKSDHPAHTALFIAFLELLGVLQADLNSFTERHLDFFYKTILRLEPRASRADSVYVTLELAPGFNSWTLPAGSLLQAGKAASGDDILFATERALTITATRLASLRNLYIDYETVRGRRAVTRLLAATQADSQDGRGAPLLRPERGWPTFSRLRQPDFAAPVPLDARLGLYIASPLLALGSGRRHVLVALVVRPANFTSMRRAWLRMLDPRERGHQPKQARRRCYRQLLDDAFVLEAGSAAGWLAVPLLHLRARRLVDGNVAIELSFALSPEHPPLVANPALPDAPPGPWPLLRLSLHPQARRYPFGAFSRARFERIEVAVDVRALAGVALRGELGTIAVDQPFYPFGALAPRGAWLDIGHAELAKQGLRQVRVRLAWLNVPSASDGLERHYAAYGQPFGAGQFVLGRAVYNGARWIDLGPQPLFAAPEGAGGGMRSVVVVAPPRAAAVTAAVPGQPARGTVRLELAGPAYGFGADLYVAAASDRAMRNAALLVDKRPTLPALLPPLMPQVRDIRCDYRARESVPLQPAAPVQETTPRLYHMYPFGWCPDGPGHDSCLLADDGSPARLYLGLSGAVPGEQLVLHFQFADDHSDTPVTWNRDDPQQAVAPLLWRYMSANRWIAFAPHAVESSTREFTRTGLVTLRLPADMDSANTAMPPGLCWIEVRASEATVRAISIGIAPHAVRAVRCSALPPDGTKPVLAPAGVTGLLKKTPAIRGVTQRYRSVGGEGGESLREFRARVSERLRHKQRAIVPADYEQLVLAQFPAIQQVKCITPNNSRRFKEGLVAPGEVALAVAATARVTTVEGTHAFVVEPVPQRVLADLAAYLAPCLSASVRKLCIRNPRQETLQVFVNVEFTGEAGIDTLTRLLNDRISAHLAPWLADPQAPLPLGCQSVHGHRVAQFIREETYVKRISKLALLHTWRDDDGYRSCRYDEAGTVQLSTPWSLFVPAEHHAIGRAVDSAPCPGIGSLGVRGSFVIGTASDAGWGRDGGPVQPPQPAPEAHYVIEVEP